MNQIDIEVAREKYSSLIKKRDEILAIKKEIKELESSPSVQRYLELKSLRNTDFSLDDNSMVLFSFSNYLSYTYKDEDKIYIYVGPYKYDNTYDSRSDIKMKDSDVEYADYLLYKNIDDKDDVKTIKPKYKEIFENKYTILKFNNTGNINRKFYFLQLFYFKELLEKGTISKEVSVKLLQKGMKDIKY